MPLAGAVVFGAVVSGESVVKAVERAGSASGKTSQEVVITACGMLPPACGGGGGGGGGGGAGDSAPKKAKSAAVSRDADF